MGGLKINGTSAHVEEALGEVLFNSMKKHKNKCAQIIADTDEYDTFEDLLNRSIRTALRLRQKNNVCERDIVAACTGNHIYSCIPFIAAQFLGAIPAYFDLNISQIGVVRLLQTLQPKVMFLAQEVVQDMMECIKQSGIQIDIIVFGESKNFSNFSEYLQFNEEENTFLPVSKISNKETALILFSSGTTGAPKGICLNHYSLLKQSRSDLIFGPCMSAKGEKVVYLVYSSLYWISSTMSLLKSIIFGNAKIICQHFEPAEAWKIIEKYKPTFAFLTPHNGLEFLEHYSEKFDTSSLSVLLIAGSQVPKKLMEGLRPVLPHTAILQAYGQTEACVITTFNFNDPEEIELQNKKPKSCGKIIDGFLWKVVDPSTEEVLGPNKEGELRIKSDCLMNGYFKMDSSSIFDSEGYMSTGDIHYYDEDYCFYAVERSKEMFKYRATHIVPSILEEVLQLHPAVKEAAVIGIPHKIDGFHPMGVVVLRDGYFNTTATEIEEFVEKRVYEVQRLRAGVKIVKELARTNTGKIQRNVIAKSILNEIPLSN